MVSLSRVRARRARGERGAALVEAAVITPVFALLIFGILEFGLTFRDYLTVSNASRDSARGASAFGDGLYADYNVIQIAKQSSKGFRPNEIQRLIIFDAGSGIKALGDQLTKSGKHKLLWLFLTHFHPDHVEGLADFPCARDKDYTLNISGASDPDKPLEQELKAALEPGFGDVMPAAKIELYELMEQTYAILPGVRLSAFYANHPGTTLAYVLTTEGRKIVYCPDSEVYGEHATALQDYDEKIGAACRGADLMFHDGRYTVEDYDKNRNSGHSSFLAAVDFAGKNLIKTLVLVHQDAGYADSVLDAMGKQAQERADERRYKVKILIGREGLRIAA